MSTVWLARRCGFLRSVEHDLDWYEVVSGMLRARGLDNARLELKPLAVYSQLPAEELGTYDLALVDGAMRTACTRTAIQAVRPGGSVYLDNADRRLRDFKDAATTLLRAVEERGTLARSFVDFCPAHFRATRGLLAQL
jgi:predicted O-methyltransferase YrrM